MKYVDHHVHTEFSPDSDAEVVKYISKAKDLGLDYVLFTDHMDFGTTDSDFKEHLDYEKYRDHMKRLEDQYEIPIKIGIEIGYEKNYRDEIERFLDSHGFDFVISSIHYGNGLDFYLGDFFTGKAKDQAYMEYFNIVLDMVKNFKTYDVVGHLDYISRYGPYDDKHYDYKDYKGIIDEILGTIIGNNNGIEINTSGLRGDLAVTFPKDEILLRYKELGGELVTVGSDSHFVRDYKADFREVIDNLNSIGLKAK